MEKDKAPTPYTLLSPCDNNLDLSYKDKWIIRTCDRRFLCLYDQLKYSLCDCIYYGFKNSIVGFDTESDAECWCKWWCGYSAELESDFKVVKFTDVFGAYYQIQAIHMRIQLNVGWVERESVMSDPEYFPIEYPDIAEKALTDLKSNLIRNLHESLIEISQHKLPNIQLQ